MLCNKLCDPREGWRLWCLWKRGLPDEGSLLRSASLCSEGRPSAPAVAPPPDPDCVPLHDDLPTCHGRDSLDCCHSLRSSPRDSPRPPTPGGQQPMETCSGPSGRSAATPHGTRSSSHLQRISHPAPQLPCFLPSLSSCRCQRDRTSQRVARWGFSGSSAQFSLQFVARHWTIRRGWQ